MNVLFVNHRIKNCGVHQFGDALCRKLQAGPGWSVQYREVDSADQLSQEIGQGSSNDVVFLNYHPTTMPWVTQEVVRSVPAPVIGLMHEFDYLNAFSAGADIFDFRALPDPSIESRVPNVTTHPRAVVGYRPSARPRDHLTVGSFGFGTPSKRFEHVVALVQREFDEATIRLQIAPAYFGDRDGESARSIAAECRRLIRKPGIKLEISHVFLSIEAIVEFLAENTVNLFLYDDGAGRGIASVVDVAIASGRPFGVSNSNMFRHLRFLCPESFVSDFSIRAICGNGESQCEKMRAAWSDEAVISSYRDAAVNAVESFRRFREGSRGFNTSLTDLERERYRAAVEEIKRLCPATMERKIAAANVQQAFVKEAVEYFSVSVANTRVLCVGSFEDTASESLKKRGLEIEEIDPSINFDLSTFYNLSTTVKSSYDIVFATSVIEHVAEDEMFLSQIRDLLCPGGVGVLTLDYKQGFMPGDPKPSTDVRLYTLGDLLERLVSTLHHCVLVDCHFWQRSVPDFVFEGVDYSFASLVFRKVEPTARSLHFAAAVETERLRRKLASLMPRTSDGRPVDISLLVEELNSRNLEIKRMTTSAGWRMTESLRSLSKAAKRLRRRLRWHKTMP